MMLILCLDSIKKASSMLTIASSWWTKASIFATDENTSSSTGRADRWALTLYEARITKKENPTCIAEGCILTTLGTR